MSDYQVIARKFRPQSFQELIGQHHVSQTLLNSLKADRTPQALLFTGPRGTGKTSTARIFAKSLRCPNAKDFIPCGKCTECDDIATGRSVDVTEIDGASNNGVDAIRELRETVGYMPSFGKHKIYIIDEVHMLSSSAFNALLKTLEEPPPHVIFIMATTEVQKIPNTILSRCQRFDFRRIPARMIAEHLSEICKQEKVKSEPESLWIIARQGDGSMRDAQSLLEQVISFADGKLTTEKVIEVLGLTDRTLLLQTLKALMERDTAAAVKVIEQLFQSGHDPAIFLRDFLEELRHLLIIKVSGDKSRDALDLPDEEIKHLAQLSANLSEEDVHLLFDMALKGAQDLNRSQDARVVLEMLILRMAAAPRIQNLRAMNFSRPHSPDAPPASTKSAPAKPVAINAKSTPVQENITTSDSTGRWLDLIERIKGVNAMLGAKLDHLQLIELSAEKIILSIPTKYKFLSAQIEDPLFMKKFKNYMTTFWGSALEVQFTDSPKAKGGVSAKEVVAKQQQNEKDNLHAEVSNHPLVKSVKDLFNSEITSIKKDQDA